MKKVVITHKKDDAPYTPRVPGGVDSYREETGGRDRLTPFFPDTKLNDLVSRIRTVPHFFDKETLVEVCSPEVAVAAAFLLPPPASGLSIVLYPGVTARLSSSFAKRHQPHGRCDYRDNCTPEKAGIP